MKIVCSSSMAYAREAFSTLGEVTVLDGRTISAEDVRDADILAIRSTTKADRALLEGSRVKFVGTATIGMDHMDIAYFERAGIQWCHSPGCNANGVSEYVTAALLSLVRRHGYTLEGKTIGVIGVGNVGSLVLEKAQVLGMRVLPNDPPRERAEGASQASGDARHDIGPSRNSLNTEHQTLNTRPAFVSLAKALTESDIITLHVPLTKEGPDKTYHMADQAFFTKMRPGCIFLNIARGDVVQTDALLGALDRGTVAHVVIDTWAGEPGYRKDLLDCVDIGTPHIAGYSFEGKYIGTLMVYREACRFLGIEPSWTPDALLPQPVVPRVDVDARGKADEEALLELVRQVYDIEQDDRKFRESSSRDERTRIREFDELRKNYPVRREFRFTEVAQKNAAPELRDKIAGLGFKVSVA